MSTPDPIEAVVAVRPPPNVAFDFFAARMGEWWDPAYTPDAATFTGIDVPPRVGGDVTMRLGDRRFVWGKVTGWVPGRRYAQSFWLAHDRTHPSTLEVEFRPKPAGSEVRLRHGGWSAETADAREKYADWQHLLDRYARLAV